MDRTLTVNGNGTLALKADQIEFSLCLESIDKEYNDAYKIAVNRSNQLTEDILSLGFKKDDLKTSEFSIEKKMESYHDEEGNYSQRFTGYAVTQRLILFCDYDTEMLGKIIRTVSSCKANPDFSIRFLVKNQKRAKARLLLQITKDAKEKAELLAKANNVTLKQLIKLDYSFDNMDFYSTTSYRMVPLARNEAMDSMDIVANDVEIHDSATFVWSIE